MTIETETETAYVANPLRAWRPNPRGVLPALPPADDLSPDARTLAREINTLRANAKRDRKAAADLRRSEDRLRREYENAVAVALRSGDKMPKDPTKDLDIRAKTLESQARSAEAAAALAMTELAEVLLTEQSEAIVETTETVAEILDELIADTAAIIEKLAALDRATSLLGFHKRITSTRPGYLLRRSSASNLAASLLRELT